MTGTYAIGFMLLSEFALLSLLVLVNVFVLQHLSLWLMAHGRNDVHHHLRHH